MEAIPDDVFRTADLAQIVPRIRQYDAVEQKITKGAKLIPMKPVLIDPRVQVKTWEVEPRLPSGLEFCAASGVITGTPAASCPPQDYKLIAASHGGPSEAYILASFEVKLSEQEVGVLIAQRL